MNVVLADRLDTMADKMDAAIEDKFRDRQTNTPKRQREAAHARQEGERLKRTQAALRGLSGAHREGIVPPTLEGIKSKKAVYDLMAEDINRSGGYYDVGAGTGQPSSKDPAAILLWAMTTPKSSEEVRQDILRKRLQELLFAKIPGYFPTPDLVIDEMLEHVIMHPTMKVLEPSGGSGAIADGILQYEPGVEMTIIEQHHSLTEVLALKGYEPIAMDFMKWEPEAGVEYDYVMMNPPFEKGQDAEHVMKAHGHLRDSGRLVAIMSPGSFFRNDKKSKTFRQWFEMLAGEKYDLPARAFRESGTNVGTVMVVIDA